MLTLSVSGKNPAEAEKIIAEAVNDSENELKILIDSPAQAATLQKSLAASGFNEVIPEDDDGTLYLIASKKQQSKADSKKVISTEPKTSGILISCEAKKYRLDFLNKFIASLTKTEHKPEIIGLINSAVKLAAYNSVTCDKLKKLEADGVRVLVSVSCADRLGITEALGAGITAEIHEIIDEIFACEKVVSI